MQELFACMTAMEQLSLKFLGDTRILNHRRWCNLTWYRILCWTVCTDVICSHIGSKQDDSSFLICDTACPVKYTNVKDATASTRRPQ